MEFEVACVYRMHKILADLSTAVEAALRDQQNTKISTEPNSEQEASRWKADLTNHLISLNEIVNDRMKTKPCDKRERQKLLQLSKVNLKGAQDEVQGEMNRSFDLIENTEQK